MAPLGQELDSVPDSLYDKLERLKSLGPVKDLSEEDEEVLQAMQVWGMLSADQLDSVVKEMQRMKAEPEEKSEKMIETEYGDEWNDEVSVIVIFSVPTLHKLSLLAHKSSKHNKRLILYLI